MTVDGVIAVTSVIWFSAVEVDVKVDVDAAAAAVDNDDNVDIDDVDVDDYACVVSDSQFVFTPYK